MASFNRYERCGCLHAAAIPAGLTYCCATARSGSLVRRSTCKPGTLWVRETTANQCEAIARKRNEFIGKVRQAIEQGKTVAILDSGDPLVYGPYAWCLEEFEDLNPVVVPGLSCFNAANAALRRGITTGEHTKSVILTATDWPGTTDTIERLSAHRTTMVVFTMTAEFNDFIEKLSANYPPETPVAVVKHAGYREQEQVIQGTLGTIAKQIGDEALPFEYLIYVGDFLTHRYRKPDNP